jgi:hypothetical protein
LFLPASPGLSAAVHRGKNRFLFLPASPGMPVVAQAVVAPSETEKRNVFFLLIVRKHSQVVFYCPLTENVQKIKTPIGRALKSLTMNPLKRYC